MFDVNRMHFNDEILRDYCQAKEGSPIWGEVQHSLWESINFRTWRESKAFPRLFTWNDLLRFPHERPIGDPYLYLALTKNYFLDQSLGQKRKSVAVVPKFRRRLNVMERIDKYIELMNYVRVAYPEHKKIIRLHPEENSLQSELSERFSFQDDWHFQSKVITKKLDRAKAQLETTCFSTELVTDYIGVHVLRRLVISKKQSHIIGEWIPYTGRDSVIQEIFELISSINSTNDDKVNGAGILLGSKWLRERSRLSHELGFSGVKKFAGKSIQRIYRLKNASTIDNTW